MSLNGYNVEDAKILHLGGKPLNAPEGRNRSLRNTFVKISLLLFPFLFIVTPVFTGYQNNLKVLYSQTPTPASIKKSRYISSTPDRILDAPDLRNDFCKLDTRFSYLYNFTSSQRKKMDGTSLHSGISKYKSKHCLAACDA